MNKKLLALYGLKWNPFSPELPTEALTLTPRIEHFYWRIEQNLIQEGGFALVTGDPGTGKPPPTLKNIYHQAGNRDAAIIAAHAIGEYSYTQIGEYFGLHFATVGRIVRKGKQGISDKRSRR